MCLEAARKAFPDNEELRAAYMLGFNAGYDKANETSLPVGLDEAAIRYAKLKEVPGEEERYYNQTGCNIYDAFKSGAEWMAGQGVTIERIVDDFGHGASIKPPTEMELDSIEAMLGDKVIVQIRKKD